MIATVYAVTLANRNGAALTVDGQPHPAAPLVFALFANRRKADEHLAAAARDAWDAEDGLRYGLGPSSEWPDDARLLRRMREHGYLATVTEQVVEL